MKRMTLIFVVSILVAAVFFPMAYAFSAIGGSGTAPALHKDDPPGHVHSDCVVDFHDDDTHLSAAVLFGGVDPPRRFLPAFTGHTLQAASRFIFVLRI